MLSNAYFLATFRFDTAENEPPPKKLQKIAEHTDTRKREPRSKPVLLRSESVSFAILNSGKIQTSEQNLAKISLNFDKLA